jgi:biopolymer transport protein ExbD
MARFKQDSKKEVPELNLGSMSDIIFTILFFFMVITNMRESNVKVDYKTPAATEIQKLEKKSLVATIYIGTPKSPEENTIPPGNISIQLNDQTVPQKDLTNRVKEFIKIEKDARPTEEEKNMLTFSLKIDKNVEMRYVSTIKTELRNNNALKINYATGKKVDMKK